MLAYINPREAALLKSHGGSGKPHADTGILSFEPEFDMGPMTEAQPLGQEFAQYEQPAPTPEISAGPQVEAPSLGPEFAPYQVQAAPTTTPAFGPSPEQSAAESARLLRQAGGAPTPTAPTAAPSKSILEQLTGATGLKGDTLARLGLAGVQGLIGARTAKKAGEQALAGKQEMQQIAAPYQQTGQQLQAQAQRGELTPAAQQSLQAARAQAAQAAERRGGVGVTQSMQAVEAFRQQLLQQQYDYGLKLSGIGDNIALGAIKTGLEADKYVNQLTNNFYTNMAYIASGMSPGVQAGGR